MTALADSGIAAGVTAQGGRVWNIPNQLAAVLHTGLRLRRLFAVVSLAIAIPWTLLLFMAHGASWANALWLLATLMPAFYAALSGSLLGIPLRLQQRTGVLQITELATNSIRLAFLLPALLLAPFSAVALACNAAGQVLQNLRLRFLQRGLLHTTVAEDPKVRKELLRTVRRLLPGTAYYAFFGQITLWIISIFGSTNSIAQVGALTRLTMILTVVSSVFGLLVIPRFTTLAADTRLLRARFLQIQAGLILLTLGLVGLVWLFPTQALWVLGSHYSHLGTEITIATAAACIGLLGGMIYTLNTVRGRIPPGYLYPLAGIATTALLATAIRPNTTVGAMTLTLWLNISTVIVGNIVFHFVPERAYQPTASL